MGLCLNEGFISGMAIYMKNTTQEKTHETTGHQSNN